MTLSHAGRTSAIALASQGSSEAVSPFTIRELRTGESYLSSKGIEHVIRPGHLARNEMQANGHPLDALVICLEASGQPVGWANYIHQVVEPLNQAPHAILYLETTFVLPQWRGQGVFKTLFEYMTVQFPGVPVRGEFTNKRLRDWVRTYNDAPLSGAKASV